MKTRTLLLTLLLVFLATLLILVFFLTRARTIFFGRASGATYSLTNSYVFASPLSAKAVSEKIRVTVFLLDDKGRGVSGKRINLTSGPAGVNFAALQADTDKMGQAVYDLTSPVAGQFVLTASVEGASFPQTVTVRFE